MRRPSSRGPSWACLSIIASASFVVGLLVNISMLQSSSPSKVLLHKNLFRQPYGLTKITGTSTAGPCDDGSNSESSAATRASSAAGASSAKRVFDAPEPAAVCATARATRSPRRGGGSFARRSTVGPGDGRDEPRDAGRRPRGHAGGP